MDYPDPYMYLGEKLLLRLTDSLLIYSEVGGGANYSGSHKL